MKTRQLFCVNSSVVTEEFQAGVECEIEDILEVTSSIHSNNIWRIEEDGSLRNNGHEFISKPLGKTELLQNFDLLHNQIRYKSDDVNVRFSQRTSTHVHINCLSLDEIQVKSIIMWYALFEPIFFLLVSPHRRNNIHCVGLDQTILSEFYKRPLKILHSKWSKYTALNILPLNKYGTIEFRHLQGTDSNELMSSWIHTLYNLWTYGKDNILNTESIKNVDAINEGFHAIFKDCPEAMKLMGAMPFLIGNSLIDIKLSLL